MIKQSHILLIILLSIIALSIIALYILKNSNNNIEGFRAIKDKTKRKIRHIHRNIKKKTNQLYSNTSISINRAIRKMGI